MATTELTVTTFEGVIDREGIVFVDWWASWCGPCRAFAPVFERVSNLHPDVTWAKVDTDAQGPLASAFGIQSIPTLMVFRDGILLFEQAGMLPQRALEDLLRQVRALDMNEVRKKASASQAAASAI